MKYYLIGYKNSEFKYLVRVKNDSYDWLCFKDDLKGLDKDSTPHTWITAEETFSEFKTFNYPNYRLKHITKKEAFAYLI